MLHSAEGLLSSPAQAARQAWRELRGLARSEGDFDAQRYFRGPSEVRFYNISTVSMRDVARKTHAIERFNERTRRELLEATRKQ